MATMTALHHPDVPAYAEWSARSNVWTLLIICPYCHRVHMHGGGSGSEPAYGYRATHCLELDVPAYHLVPGPPDMPRPKRQGRRHIPRGRVINTVNNANGAKGYVVPDLLVTCKVCHVEFEPERMAIMSGNWRVCAPCQADGSPGSRPNRELKADAVGVPANPERNGNS